MKSGVRNGKSGRTILSGLRRGGVASVVAIMISACAWQQTEAGQPIVGEYSQTFTTPTNLNGMVVTGWVSFYSPTTGVESAVLAANSVMWGQSLPGGTRFHFTRGGKPDWCFLSRNWEIKGHLFNGGGHDWMTCFYPSGQLESGGLVHVEVIDGFPCQAAASGFWGLHHPRTCFYEDGKLKSAEAAVTFRYRGTIVEKGKYVELKPDGSIASVK